MPKYVIEREMPGAGSMSPAEIKAAAEQSIGVINGLPTINWQHSYVTDDKIYCVYIAPNEEVIREHARVAGFPADRISRVRTIMDPTTAETVAEPLLN